VLEPVKQAQEKRARAACPDTGGRTTHHECTAAVSRTVVDTSHPRSCGGVGRLPGGCNRLHSQSTSPRLLAKKLAETPVVATEARRTHRCLRKPCQPKTIPRLFERVDEFGTVVASHRQAVAAAASVSVKATTWPWYEAEDTHVPRRCWGVVPVGDAATEPAGTTNTDFLGRQCQQSQQVWGAEVLKRPCQVCRACCVCMARHLGSSVHLCLRMQVSAAGRRLGGCTPFAVVGGNVDVLWWLCDKGMITQ
jgi:hypothetical protein